MSNQSVISGGNYLNTKTAFTGHTLAADEEAAGHEAWRIATGRRSPYTNYYQSITANAQRTLTLTCDRERMADLFVLDRGHNLTRVILERSYDNFVTTITVFDITLPAVSGTGSLDDDFGVISEEGAWYKRFPAVSAPYWRVKIPALGANLKPKVVGMHLSKSFAFDCWRPHAPDQVETGGDMAESDAGWQAVASLYERHADTMLVKLSTPFDYEQARVAFRHYQMRRPAFYVPDEDNARNAICIIKPPSVQGFVRDVGWFSEMASLPYLEHESAGL